MKPPLTPAEHIAEAKGYLAEGAPAEHAIAHALVAIAETMQINIAATVVDSFGRGAMTTAGAVASIFGAVAPGAPLSDNICANCRAHHDKHSNDDLSCPAWTKPDGEIVFSTTHRYTGRTRP